MICTVCEILFLCPYYPNDAIVVDVEVLNTQLSLHLNGASGSAELFVFDFERFFGAMLPQDPSMTSEMLEEVLPLVHACRMSTKLINLGNIQFR